MKHVTDDTQIVDPQAVQGFLRDALAEVERGEMAVVADALARKSATFGQLLGTRERIEALDEPALREVVGHIFAARRHDALLTDSGVQQACDAVAALLYSAEGIGRRIDLFCERMQPAAPELPWWEVAAELLHFTHPQDYWLWTRWIYHPQAGSGALPFLMGGDYDLDGDSHGERYLKIGRTVAMASNYAELVGFAGPELRANARALFMPDVFLAAVYAVYMYSVSSWKLSREFNKVLPTLPRLVCRLLGVNEIV